MLVSVSTTQLDRRQRRTWQDRDKRDRIETDMKDMKETDVGNTIEVIDMTWMTKHNIHWAEKHKHKRAIQYKVNVCVCGCNINLNRYSPFSAAQ
jgi:hypothetical protein